MSSPTPGGPIIGEVIHRLDRIDETIGLVRGELAASLAEVRAYRATIDAYRAEVTAWRQETTARFDQIDRELGGLAVRFFDHRHDDEGRAV